MLHGGTYVDDECGLTIPTESVLEDTRELGIPERHERSLWVSEGVDALPKSS